MPEPIAPNETLSAASRPLPRRCRAHGLVQDADGRCALCWRVAAGRRAWVGWMALAPLSALAGAGGVMATRHVTDVAPLADVAPQGARHTLELGAASHAAPARERAPRAFGIDAVAPDAAPRALRVFRIEVMTSDVALAPGALCAMPVDAVVQSSARAPAEDCAAGRALAELGLQAAAEPPPQHAAVDPELPAFDDPLDFGLPRAR